MNNTNHTTVAQQEEGSPWECARAGQMCTDGQVPKSEASGDIYEFSQLQYSNEYFRESDETCTNKPNAVYQVVSPVICQSDQTSFTDQDMNHVGNQMTNMLTNKRKTAKILSHTDTKRCKKQNSTFICKHCGKWLQSENPYVFHLEDHTIQARGHLCRKCGLYFHSKLDMAQHQIWHKLRLPREQLRYEFEREGKIVLMCCVCGVECETSTILYDHIKRTHVKRLCCPRNQRLKQVPMVKGTEIKCTKAVLAHSAEAWKKSLAMECKKGEEHDGKILIQRFGPTAASQTVKSEPEKCGYVENAYKVCVKEEKPELEGATLFTAGTQEINNKPKVEVPLLPDMKPLLHLSLPKDEPSDGQRGKFEDGTNSVKPLTTSPGNIADGVKAAPVVLYRNYQVWTKSETPVKVSSHEADVPSTVSVQPTNQTISSAVGPFTSGLSDRNTSTGNLSAASVTCTAVQYPQSPEYITQTATKSTTQSCNSASNFEDVKSQNPENSRQYSRSTKESQTYKNGNEQCTVVKREVPLSATDQAETSMQFSKDAQDGSLSMAAALMHRNVKVGAASSKKFSLTDQKKSPNHIEVALNRNDEIVNMVKPDSKANKECNGNGLMNSDANTTPKVFTTIPCIPSQTPENAAVKLNVTQTNVNVSTGPTCTNVPMPSTMFQCPITLPGNVSQAKALYSGANVFSGVLRNQKLMFLRPYRMLPGFGPPTHNTVAYTVIGTHVTSQNLCAGENKILPNTAAFQANVPSAQGNVIVPYLFSMASKSFSSTTFQENVPIPNIPTQSQGNLLSVSAAIGHPNTNSSPAGLNDFVHSSTPVCSQKSVATKKQTRRQGNAHVDSTCAVAVANSKSASTPSKAASCVQNQSLAEELTKSNNSTIADHSTDLGNKLMCDDCQTECPTRKLMNGHKDSACDAKYEGQPYVCKFCQRKFMKRNYWYLHEKTHITFQCDICNEEFPSKGAVYMHHLSHCKCHRCGSQFPNSSDLSVHIQRAHNEYMFPCDKCEVMLTTRYQRTQHVHVHCCNPLKQEYRCDRCSETYNRLFSLRAHMDSKHEDGF